jgi:hypothetical protein
MNEAAAVVFLEEFASGFVTDGVDAGWEYFAAGSYVADDGVVTTSARGLEIVASGTNAKTGEPAFVRTLAPEARNSAGLPGTLDHLKWLTFIRHNASSGFPGFDADPGQVLSCAGWLTARTYGTADHPFGDGVAEADIDLRLAAVTMNAVDAETLMIFDFFVTNAKIYAFYERLPDRREELGDYAAFSYAIPVADRQPEDHNRLEISYDRSAGTVRWSVDGRTVFEVDRIGMRLDARQHLVLDLGGSEQRVEPRQLGFGIGMLTLLDARLAGSPALVRLSNAPSLYYDPAADTPVGQTFRDDESMADNRLFGQGAALRLSRIVVTSGPAGSHGG